MTESGRDVSDEPVEACEVETPDWSRFKPEAAPKCVTPNQCYTTTQVSKMLGIEVKAVHNLCRDPKRPKHSDVNNSLPGTSAIFQKL